MKHDLSNGKIYNQLTILCKTDKINKFGLFLYLVQCSCGKQIEITGQDMYQERYKSCGCRKFRNSSRRLKPGEALLNEKYSNFVSHGRSKGIPVEIDRSQWETLIKKNCYYCGCSPSREIVDRFGRTSKPEWVEQSRQKVNGIDRFENEYGYTLENSVSCCWTCNNMKNTMDGIQFLEHLEKILNTQRVIPDIQHIHKSLKRTKK